MAMKTNVLVHQYDEIVVSTDSITAEENTNDSAILSYRLPTFLNNFITSIEEKLSVLLTVIALFQNVKLCMEKYDVIKFNSFVDMAWRTKVLCFDRRGTAEDMEQLRSISTKPLK